MKGGTNLCDYTISEVFHYITIACVQLSLVGLGNGLDCNGGSKCQERPKLHDAGWGGRCPRTGRVKRDY